MFEFQSSPEIDGFLVLNHCIKTGDRFFKIFMRDRDLYATLDAIKKLLADNQISSSFRFTTPTSFCLYNGIEVNIRDLRRTIDCLYKAQLISISDRADIEPALRKREKDLNNFDALIESISISQSDICKSCTDLYVEELCDIAKNANHAVTLIMYACDEIWFYPNANIMLNLKKLFPAVTFDEDTKLRLTDALISFSKFYHGQGNLESTLIQNGMGLPLPKLQRAAMLSSAKQKFIEKFTDIDNTNLFESIFTINVKILDYRIEDNLSVIPAPLVYPMPSKNEQDLVFIKLVANTLLETNLTLNNIRLDIRLKIANLYIALWNNIKNIDNTINALTNEERILYQNIYESINKETTDKIFSDARSSFQERCDRFQTVDKENRGLFFQDFNQHKKDIQEGSYFSKQSRNQRY